MKESESNQVGLENGRGLMRVVCREVQLEGVRGLRWALGFWASLGLGTQLELNHWAWLLLIISTTPLFWGPAWPAGDNNKRQVNLLPQETHVQSCDKLATITDHRLP